jgi:hypothetical protein
VYSQFELIKMIIGKVNNNFLLFWGTYKFNVCYGYFRKIAASPLLGCQLNYFSEDTMACALASPV